MKTNIKNALLSAAFVVAICSACLTVNAAPVIKTANTVATSDTGKMDKMKMDKMKMKKKKKMDKMSKDKMAKDTSKMSKM